MLKNFKNILFIGFLLVQYGLFTTALPASSTSDDHKNNAIDEEQEEDLSARTKLLFFTLEEFISLSNFTLERGTNIFRNILKDTSVNKKNTELQEHLAKLSNFIEKVDQLREGEAIQIQFYDKVIEFTDIVESFNNTETENVTAKDLQLQNLLKKHGFEQMEVEFLELFHSFSQKFNKEAEKYFLTLSEKEKISEAEMITWYEKFKNENDGEKKVEMFAKFFDFYKTL